MDDADVMRVAVVSLALFAALSLYLYAFGLL